MNGVHAETQASRALDECVELAEAKMAEPNYEMHARLMRTYLDVRTGKTLQRLDDRSPSADELLDGLAQMLLVLPALNESRQRRLLYRRRTEIIEQLRLVQRIAQGCRTY